MKKIAYILFAAVLTTNSCSVKEAEIQAVEAVSKLEAVTTFEAYMEEPKTSYTINGEGTRAVFAWAQGDEIDAAVVRGGVYSPVRFVAQSSGVQTTFSDASSDPKVSDFQDAVLTDIAFYPSRISDTAQQGGFNLEWSIRDNNDKTTYPDDDVLITVDLPSEVTVPQGNPLSTVPMIGKRTAPDTYGFVPMTGVLAVPVRNMPDGIDYALLESEDAAISGSFHVIRDGNYISQSSSLSAGHSLKLNFSNVGEDYTFYFPIAAGTIPAGLKICFGSSSDPDSRMVITTQRALTIKNGVIALSPEVVFAPVDQQWADYIEGSFLDDFIWQQRGWDASTWVPVVIQRSGLNPNKYRIANPYSTAATQFGYTPATEGIATDDYFVFYIDGDSVSYVNMDTGIEDSVGRPLGVNYRSANAAYTHIVSTQSDGTVLEVQFAGFYTIEGNFYTKDNFEGSPKIHLLFNHPAETETWKEVGTLQYKDDFWVNGIMNKSVDLHVDVVLEQSNLDPMRFRIANPYPALAVEAGADDAYCYFGAEVSPYLIMTVDSENKITYEEFRPGIGRADWEFSLCDPSDWNTKSSVQVVEGNSRVVLYSSDGIPQIIRIYGVYHKIGEYNTGNRYSRVDDQYGDAVVIARSIPIDSWESIGNGRFKDKLVWSCAGLTEYAEAEFQKSLISDTRFRIAKPYPGTNSDEWFVFDVANPNAVTSDNYYVDSEVTASGKETFKPWVRNGVDYGYNYSSVLLWQDNGLPSVVQIGPCYRGAGFDGTTEGYKYEIGRDHEQLAVEIVFPGCETYQTQLYTVKATHYEVPLKAEFHNPIASLELPTGTLKRLTVKISGIDLGTVTGLRLWDNYYGWIDSDYVAPDAGGIVTMTSFLNTITAGHSLDLNCWLTSAPIGAGVHFEILEVVMEIGGVEMSLPIKQDSSVTHLAGVVINTGGDVINVRGGEETVASFRIPALVTSNAGTLIAAYDVRYANSSDLQGDIDVGVKRSTDGGKTWSDLVLAMDMGEYGGLNQTNNGIGDPCLLVDENTGRIFCFAVWAHGHYSDPDRRCLAWAGTGFDIADTPQLMMVYSDDDGRSWSEPVNITRQIKKYDWMMTFQGPGRGITMKDGTLVIPIQHQEGAEKNMHDLYPLNSGIAYSTDHGVTWHAHNFAHSITSESTVAEIEPGVLLLSMRDETDSHYRRNYITRDLGRTWTAHSSNGTWLDSTCEASMIHVDASANALGKDLLIFSNPHNTVRSKMTIQVSQDKGESFSHSLLVDAYGSLGYSCLTMIDENTVGILYESSRANIYFQAIPLNEIVK